jgi:type I restriction enzyme R subunit
MEYFDSAYQLGMTATPKRKDNANTYAYFGAPVYTYSLKQGIEDGFLVPFRVEIVSVSALTPCSSSDKFLPLHTHF